MQITTEQNKLTDRYTGLMLKANTFEDERALEMLTAALTQEGACITIVLPDGSYLRFGMEEAGS